MTRLISWALFLCALVPCGCSFLDRGAGLPAGLSGSGESVPPASVAPGLLRVSVRWPVLDRPGFKAAAIPTTTRAIRLILRDATSTRLDTLVLRPADGSATTAVLSVQPGENLSLEATAYREADASGPALARGTAAGLQVLSTRETSVRLVLDALWVPAIASMSTVVGIAGDELELWGENLDPVEGATPEVRFGGVGPAEVRSASSASLRVVVPSGAVVGQVVVARDGIPSTGQALFWPMDPASLSVLATKDAYDPLPSNVRLVIQGATKSFQVPAPWAWPGGVANPALVPPSGTWELADAPGQLTQQGLFTAGPSDGTGSIRHVVAGRALQPLEVSVASLSLEASPSSVAVDVVQPGSTDSVQLAVRQRLSTGQALLDPMAWLAITSSDPGVAQVSSDGLVRLIAVSVDRVATVSVVSRVASVSTEVSVAVKGLPLGTSLIRSGTFLMGSPTSESDRASDETQHQVTLTRDFLMRRTEVTQGQWRALMGNNPSFSRGDDNRPVEKVNWYDALAYANALSVRDGLASAYDLSSCSGTPGTGTFTCGGVSLTASTPYATMGWRLPTEAEWEYAYRADTTTPWYFGADSNLLGSYGWFNGNSGSTTQPVGQKEPNGWGLHDMAGNVWEWCWDWYGIYPGTVTDPAGPTSGSKRVFHGGSFTYDASFTRAARRFFEFPNQPHSTCGFRLCRSRP